MSLSRAEYLINKLISNKLSREELAELVSSVNSESEQQKYSDVLENYFNQLLRESEGDRSDK